MTLLRDLPIQGAQSVASLLWPVFEERNGCIFLAGQHTTTRMSGLDKTGAEAFVNHVHILDLFKHAASDVERPQNIGYREAHPDFRAACEFGKVMARTWFYKLKEDYPSYRFRVYYTQEDNPVVRFHRVREGEPVWLDEGGWREAVERGEVMVLDTTSQPMEVRVGGNQVTPGRPEGT